MNPILKQIIESEIVTSEDGMQYRLHSHLPSIEGAILTEWIKNLKPKAILEIGLAYGISSMIICDAASTYSLQSYDIIDCFQRGEWKSIGLCNLEKSGYLRHITFHEERSEIQLPLFLKEKKKFDFVFVDGDHRFNHVFVEFYYIDKILKTGGTIVFDDAHLDSLQKVFSFIECYGGYERIPLPDIDQKTQLKVRKMMGVLQSRIVGFKKVKSVSHEWDWFQDF